MVSGTEYISNEEGQVIIRLQDDQKPIRNADCIVSVLYPNKTFFFEDKQMKETSIPGNYYYNFTTPSQTGVYEEIISCNIDNSKVYISSTFHVSTGLNMIAELMDKQEKHYNELMYEINQTNENMTNRLDLIETNMNKTISDKFDNMSKKFSESAKAMSEIFS